MCTRAWFFTSTGTPSDPSTRSFSREPQAEAVDPKGLGIGLAVVREVVNLHKGSVQARSGGRGKGAEFSVRLPAAQPQSIEG